MKDAPKEDEIVFVEGGDQGAFDELQPGTEPFSGGGDFGIPPTDMQDDVQIEDPVSKVASAPAKNILILAIMTIASIFFIYKVVFVQSEEEIAKEKQAEQVESQPVDTAVLPTKQLEKPQVNIGVVDTPELPAIESVQPPPLPLPTPPQPVKDEPVVKQEPVVVAPPPAIEPKVPEPKEAFIEEPTAEPQLEDVQTAHIPTREERLFARKNAPMLIQNSGGRPSQEGISGKDKAGESAVTPIKATKVKDLGRMILQGKMIDALLETTINTDLPGSLRAIISRDVYAESGRSILIPHGSRLIGTYNNSIQAGQQRVIINWQRVIRPDGVDIEISSPGTDQLGRAGSTGIVDNKYFELFSNSLLLSAVTIAGTSLLSKVQDSQPVSTTSSTSPTGESGSTQTGAATDTAVLQGVQNLGDVAKQVAKGSSTQPTIIVNQGTRLKVFVNKDLIFPEDTIIRNLSNN